MSTYAISDIHGEYDKFMKLLKIINFSDEDLLYILGDVVDRGPHPIKTLLKLMEMPNAICVVGNHEMMAVECLKFLCTEITESSIRDIDPKMLDNVATWQINGSATTIDEFRQLDRARQQDVLDFFGEFTVYEEVSAGGKDFILVHSGIGSFSPEKDMDEYDIYDLVWTRADYTRQYFPDIFVVSGHTPTQFIENNPRPGYIFKHNNHIAIDCGAYLAGGRLSAICLDTLEEFYSDD